MKQTLLNSSALTPLVWRKVSGWTSLIAMLAAGPVAHAQETTPVPDISVVAPLAGPAPASAGTQASGGGAPSAGATPSNAAPVPTEGSEAAGYKPSTVSNFGPLGPTPILDVPYSVNVISASLIENLQMSKPDDFVKIDPTLQMTLYSTRTAYNNIGARGFLLSNASGKGEDGMVLQNLYPISLEDKERVEIYTGLTSFLYGPTSVGGFMNYAYKRPTDTPLASLTVGDYGGLSSYVHAEFGGPVKIPGLQDGLFSYRLNIVGQDGATAVNGQYEKRDLLTAALTWHITENAALTVIGSHTDQQIKGEDAGWFTSTNANGTLKFPYPAAPNPSQSYSQPWAGYNYQRDRIGADLNWKWNDTFTLRASYAYSQVAGRDVFAADNATQTGNVSYSQTFAPISNYYLYANTGYLLLDSSFDIWFMHHKVTAGFYGNDMLTRESPTSYSSHTYSNLIYGTTYYIGQPAFIASNAGPPANLLYNNARNIVIGDEVKFGEQWSALIGANETALSSRSYNNTVGANDALTAAYDKSRITPAASLIFKPIPWVSTYATYSQSLQQGAAVQNSSGTIYTNNGQILSPYTGTEYEVGAKANVGGMLLTASLFQITQALQYVQYNNNGTFTYVQNGLQRSRGVELTATGSLFEGFRIFGGVTLLDPREYQAQTSSIAPVINGNTPPNVASQLAKLTAEYDLPFVKGLTLTGGYYFTGKMAINIYDGYYLPSVATEDLGFRYRTPELFGQKLPVGQELVLRFNVSNITDRAYWASYGYVGQPRTFMASAQLKF